MKFNGMSTHQKTAIVYEQTAALIDNALLTGPEVHPSKDAAIYAVEEPAATYDSGASDTEAFPLLRWA